MKQKTYLLVWILFAVIPLPLFAGDWSIFLAGGNGLIRTNVGGMDAVQYKFYEEYATNAENKYSPALQKSAEVAQIGAILPHGVASKEKHYRVGVDALISSSKIFGINLGASYVDARLGCDNNCGEIEAPFTVTWLNEVYLPSYNKSGALDGDDKIKALAADHLQKSLNPPKMRYSYGTVDVGFSIHFNPNGTWDPYVGADLGLGRLSGDMTGGIAKAAGKAGLRVNLGSAFYLFVQGERQNLRYVVSNKTRDYMSQNFTDSVGLVGLGIKL